jgi:hypothetical protein
MPVEERCPMLQSINTLNDLPLSNQGKLLF